MPTPTAPVTLYRDPAIFERERETIFARTWQFLGLEADFGRTGDYLADTFAGYPVVVVRDETGVLRGFHNVCRHRAGPLVADAKGRCDRALVCQFHSWRYGFDGRLLDASGFDPADGYDPAALGLFPIRVETWRGFVFVNLDAGAAPLADSLQPLDERLGIQIARPARVRDRHPVACNWKVLVENYLDGFHRDGVHAAPGAGAGAHRHPVHLHGDVAVYQNSFPGGGVESLWAWVWPNLGLSLHRGVLTVESFRPEGPDRTVIDHVFLHEPEDPSVEVAILSAERVTEEDTWICERVQQNLDAGAYQTGWLSPSHEQAVASFQGRVSAALAPF